MRAKVFVTMLLVGAVAFLLEPTPGLTQMGGPPPGPPGQGGMGRGGGGGGGQWGGGRRGGGGGWGRMGGGGGRMQFDPNQFFNTLSGGKDVIVRAQLNPQQQMMYDRMTRRLGNPPQITRQQFTEMFQQRMGQRGAGAPGAPGGGAQNVDSWAENSFRRLDVNGDGLLNNDEMPEPLKSERDKWDTNKDGFIDLNEYKEYFRQRMADRGFGQQGGGWGGNPGTMPDLTPPPEEEDKRPVVYRAGKLPKDLPSWFQQIDKDNDGQIGLWEWRAAGRGVEEFLAMDRNKDGFLTAEEVLRYEKQQKETQAKAPPGGTPGGPGAGFGGGPGGAFGPGAPGGRPMGGFSGRPGGNRWRGGFSGGGRN